MTRSRTALLASALLLMPGAALAATEVSDQADAVAEQARQLAAETNALSNAVVTDVDGAVDADGRTVDDRNDRDDDDGFDSGLLGLLGLAGLLGLKRRDDRDHRDHRDHRTTTVGGDSTGTRL